MSNIAFWLEGSGLAVLDVDIGEGKDGGAELTKLLNDRPLPETRECATPSGGRHIYFRVRDGLPKNTSNVLGRGLDVWHGKHYVLLPPSNHKSGRIYQWTSEREAPTWPDVLMPVKRPVGRPPKTAKADHPFNVSDSDDCARLGHALAYIDASPRPTWVNVGLILGRLFNRSEEGWEVYREWSASTKANNYDEVLSRKNYFNDSQNPSQGAAITVASIFQWAKESGCPEWEKPDDGRLSFVNIPDNRGASLDALGKLVVEAKLPVYVRGTDLVDIVVSGGLTEVERRKLEARNIRVPEGTPFLRELTASRFEDIASPHIVWRERLKSGKARSGPYRVATVEAFLGRMNWPGSGNLSGFVQHPTIRSLQDRSIISELGLDSRSGLYLTDTLDLDIPARKLTKEDAETAIEVMWVPFGKFNFLEPEKAKATVLAAVMTSGNEALLRHGSVPCSRVRNPG